MKSIAPGGAPHEFTTWVGAQPVATRTYDALVGTDAHVKLREQRLEQQGYVCPYTQVELTGADQCHVEHITPQTQNPALQLDYDNMIACYPAPNAPHPGYGAVQKAGTAVSPNTFVWPTERTTEHRFAFDRTGAVRAASDNDSAAKNAISMLKLDGQTLVDLREAAIRSVGLAANSPRPKSAAAARTFAHQVLQRTNGRYEPFCVALSQVAISYAERKERRARSMRGNRDGR